MARRPAPTKANLFYAQRQLRFASEGRGLLQQKRDVLVLELMGLAAGFADTEEKLRTRLDRALENFLPAAIHLGRDTIERAVSMHQPELTLEMDPHSVMGISLPHVSVSVKAELTSPGTLTSSAALDNTLQDMQQVIETIGDYVEAVATIWKLAIEVEKTQKRINALENIFIPEAERTIQWIKSVMEENDREDLFRRKRLKSRAA